MSRHLVEALGKPGNIVRLSSRESRHLTKVLRLVDGDPLIVFDGNGREADALLVKHPTGGMAVRILKVRNLDAAANLRIHAACGLIRGDRLFRMVEKLTELNTYTIICFQSERSTRKISSTLFDRLEKTAISAAKQSGRCHLPKIHVAGSLSEALAMCPDSAIRLHFEIDAGNHLKDIHRDNHAIHDIFTVFGPEGGFSPKEIMELEKSESIDLGLGGNVLRTETAAVAGVSLLNFLFE
jgi:16S rRNA (uracil1498-N3)-methyltransferase